ncbi:hypothetical protein ARTSIC4J27_265 [Pseudarthrobacter siccitolerans]|uniref:Uncharacterized protein n=1 Tax=Pseudarthrobacter siccitolerans TaxID=861266 RepID=A0A024GXY3_9MICC|nr:hypothetical protein [Pseudarthrobacter siccitolerans]CCQ44341.1 hypothetical protein ARTSIC4J27_265 [Pseudarthrobacter siccitolerans]
MASPEHHRSTAEALLEQAKGYAPSSAPRLAYLAEAQVHATLALSAPVEIKPVRTRKATAAKSEEAAK